MTMFLVLLILVFLSGAAGLLYEIVWARMLVHTLGSTAEAVSAILAAFLGGMAVGALLLGRRAERTKRPLLLYASLEAVIGIYALAFPVVEGLFRALVLAAASGGAGGGPLAALLRFLGVFILLLPATAAMGGTIPVLCRFAVRSERRLGGRVGTLYAVNTLGGAIGCLAAGFLTIRFLGITSSLQLGAVTNLAVAAAAAWLARGRSVVDARGTDLPGAAARDARLSLADLVVLLAFAVSGFTALGYEVLWTRVLVFFVRSVTYSFSLMLATLLLGLVVGSAVASAVADRRGWAIPSFAAVEIGAGAAAFTSVYLLLTRTEALLALAPSAGGQLVNLYVGQAFLVLAAIFPAGVLFGATFPFAVRALVPEAGRTPGRVGLATAFNTGGGILGAYAIGFLLLPAAGVITSLKTLVVLNAIAGTAVVALAGGLPADRPGRRVRTPLRLGLAGAAALLIAGVLSSPDFLLRRLAELRPGEMIMIDEGEDVIVTVYEDDIDGPGSRTLYVDGTSYTGSRFFAQRYMKVMGHLPLLLCDTKERALVICLGTGMTLSAVARHADLERIACAELSAGVERALPLFADVNDNVAENPRVEIEIQDGRHYVLTRDEMWDVVTLEPPPPLNAGVCDLYSREFYQVVKRRLSPGGVLCQWFPLHSQTVDEYRMALKTFADVFPDCSLWVPVGRNSLGIGVKEGGAPWTFERIKRRFEDPPVRRALGEIGFPTPESMLATLVLDAEAIARLVGDAPPVTDDWPRLEFHDPAKAGERFPAGWLLNELGRHRVDPLLWLETRGRAEGVDQPGYVRSRQALIFYFQGVVRYEEGDREGATESWLNAIRAQPDNAYYRSILVVR